MSFGLDEEVKTEENGSTYEAEGIINIDKKRRPFAYWTVGGKEYRMKLTTAVICQLEDKFKRNLLDMLFSSGSVPPLGVMLTITQGAMKSWEHGIKYSDVQALFDQYCEEGGTQMSFMTDVLMEIYKVSGFFSKNQLEDMDEKLEAAKAEL